MVRSHEVVPDWSSVPAGVRAVAEPVLDAFLGGVSAPGPWTLAQERDGRDFTLVWADYGGHTTNKAQGVAAMLRIYERFGNWDIAIQSTNTTQWVIRFRPRMT